MPEDIEAIIGILLVMGGLPFAMQWLDQAMDQPSTTPSRRRHRENSWRE
ncbi:hypothetical protein [Allobranchiibius huperziae]|uniref:Uncharacterized protein n=1 Tax=Allobranchiibius huperziae TaxID=1874116 RepID=A0A853DGV8_9MICO|nr:hypothetical protein [Allobranchiibius huperziae]NYJ74081.1 hypothetical protein [Allobranchiibius huperziae]